MSSKLCQVIAVVNGKKTRTQRAITEVYKKLQKAPLFEGITRTYHKVTEDGDDFPPEKKNVQFTVKQALQEIEKSLTDLIDSVATQDFANCKAKADIMVDGKVVLKDIPVTHLLFLEKQITDLRAMLGALPTLDPADKWTFNQDADFYASQPFRTTKTQKQPRSHVLYPATEQHPAQVEMYHEDVKIGEWETIKFSGAIPAQERNEMLERLDALQEAVKRAREAANSMEEVQNVKIGKKIFQFVLGNNA